jgi:hypothetical protein
MIPAPPVIWPSVLTPPGEIEGVKGLYAMLMAVQGPVEAWVAALALYATSRSPPASVPRPIARHWRFMAANECVMELYHLRERMKKVRSVSIRACPSLIPLIDRSRTWAPIKALDDAFPGIEGLRHAAAHKGQNDAHPEQHRPAGVRWALSGFRSGDTYSAPHERAMYSLDISAASLAIIRDAVGEFFAAYDDAAAELERQGHLPD